MALDQLLGQPAARRTLQRALEKDRVHHAYRFEGPPGVGKTTAAMLLAQALVCENGRRGCGQCSACKRAITLSPDAPEVPQHPDVLFVGRGLYPESVLGKAEATGISVEQIRRIVLGRLGFRPHEGRALVVVIFDADELTHAAESALLKTLEEPPADTYFILMSSRPGKLLDTIRSRTLAVRFAPLPETVVRQLLEREGLSPELAVLAQGSLTRARALGQPETQDSLADFVRGADAAVQAPHSDGALEFAAARPEGRDAVLLHLGHLASSCALEGRAAEPHEAPLWAEHFFEVSRAASEIERNGSAALVLEALILRLRKLPRAQRKTSFLP